MPFFSVVITVFNKANYIRSTLESVLKQEFKDFEIIIVNDGSTDHSIEVINAFKDDRITLISTKNQGASVARNTGIDAALSPFIALLDGDDLWQPTYLSEIHSAILSNPKINVFSTAIAQKYEDKIVPVPYNFRQKQNFEVHDYFESSLKYTILSGSSIVFKKAITEVIGFFDTSIISGQDTDMWIRIGLTYKIGFINKILVHYRYVATSLSNTTFEASKKPTFENYKALEKEHKPLKKLLDINRYSLALMCKINNQKEAFIFYKSNLDASNLNLSKRLLLHAPKWVLHVLLWLKSLKKEKLYYKPL